VLLVYAAHLVSGQIAAGDDAIEAGWFGPDELPEIAFRTHRAVLRQWRQARAVVYRPATLADAEVVTMLGEVYPAEASGSCAREFCSPSRQLYVAVDKEQVIGFCGMAQDADTCTGRIVQVFVHPRYRRWGIGTHLLTCCVEGGREAGLRALLAHAPITNPGWGVYLKAGFRVSGFTNDYYGRGAKDDPQAAPQTALLLTYDLDKNLGLGVNRRPTES
jgi:GNAT superfamily N-acetyltransferase